MSRTLYLLTDSQSSTRFQTRRFCSKIGKETSLERAVFHSLVKPHWFWTFACSPSLCSPSALGFPTLSLGSPGPFFLPPPAHIKDRLQTDWGIVVFPSRTLQCKARCTCESNCSMFSTRPDTTGLTQKKSRLESLS